MDHGGLVHEEPMNLPPGFRFHPTDEELIIHYLRKKAADSSFSSVAIGEADLNKCEPWDLPSMAKMGEKEWYLFCMKDRKYPTGLRTNRATQTGYWKATGKDKEIYMDTDNNNQKCKMLVGMKKTLVFYKGRAPKGEKSDWVMHEFRLDARVSSYNQRNEWVICRVFKKSPGDKKSIDISRAAPQEQHLHYSSCPTDMSTCMSMRSHVTCFSSDDVDTHTAVPNDVFAEYLCPSLSLVQLLESNICPGERGNVNDNGSHSHSKASQETGITCDINPEISSVASASAQEGPPSTSAHVSFPLAQRFWTY